MYTGLTPAEIGGYAEVPAGMPSTSDKYMDSSAMHDEIIGKNFPAAEMQISKLQVCLQPNAHLCFSKGGGFGAHTKGLCSHYAQHTEMTSRPGKY